MSCIVLYNTKKYDVCKFLGLHPGGREIILGFQNQDITEAYDNIGHSKNADKILAKYVIEEVLETESVAVKSDKGTIDVKYATKKLFTSEDPYHIHKTLGILSLLNFVYRYCYVLPSTNTLGYGTNYVFDTATIIMHLMLSYSSIIFHVLKHRIPERPLIIYEEYRLHAMIFSTRGALTSLYGMYSYLIPEMYRQFGLALLMLATSIIVDLITYKYGTPGITAIRNNNDGSVKLLKLGYAYYQFIAMGSVIILNPLTCDLGFNTLIAIQSSAFLMTLKRKSIIRWYSHAFWYSLALLFSSYYIWRVKGTTFMGYILGLFILRSQFNVSKYLIWSLWLGVSVLYLK